MVMSFTKVKQQKTGKYLQSKGGIITMQDLAQYEAMENCLKI
jgi:gamma-glutamyltranspeptidase